MNRVIKARLIALGLAVALIGALIVAATLNSEREAGDISDRLGQVDTESFLIADRFKEKLRFANDKMRRYAITHDPVIWQEYVNAAGEVQQWIIAEQIQLRTDRERALLKQMGVACGTYLEDAKSLHARVETSQEAGASLAEYNTVSLASRHLNDLGQELARIHYDTRNAFLADVNQTLSRLRWSVLGLVGLLFLFGVALAAGVYRDLIAPLKVKLVQSQAEAEHHEKLAALGLLAAGVAHEIRNPLTAIRTAVFLQQKKTLPSSPARGELDLVEREIMRLERIVNAFLQFARPADPELTTMPADRALEEVQALFANQFAQTGIRLQREESPGLRIKVDPAQIKQVLINLVQNAADSIGGPGLVTLRARPDRKALTNGETDVVVLEVSDSGNGIPPAVEKRLFDPFFTTKENGTGLGLSIAARIVAIHGGALQYQTQINRGTTFGVVLPRVV